MDRCLIEEIQQNINNCASSRRYISVHYIILSTFKFEIFLNRILGEIYEYTI